MLDESGENWVLNLSLIHILPPRKKSGVMITGETPEECAAKLYEALNSAHII